jgi:hypothetical protein
MDGPDVESEVTLSKRSKTIVHQTENQERGRMFLLVDVDTIICRYRWRNMFVAVTRAVLCLLLTLYLPCLQNQPLRPSGLIGPNLDRGIELHASPITAHILNNSSLFCSALPGS